MPDKPTTDTAPADDGRVWEWQETLLYRGTETECAEAFAAFREKKNGVHFVMGLADRKKDR